MVRSTVGASPSSPRPSPREPGAAAPVEGVRTRTPPPGQRSALLVSAFTHLVKVARAADGRSAGNRLALAPDVVVAASELAAPSPGGKATDRSRAAGADSTDGGRERSVGQHAHRRGVTGSGLQGEQLDGAPLPRSQPATTADAGLGNVLLQSRSLRPGSRPRGVARSHSPPPRDTTWVQLPRRRDRWLGVRRVVYGDAPRVPRTDRGAMGQVAVSLSHLRAGSPRGQGLTQSPARCGLTAADGVLAPHTLHPRPDDGIPGLLPVIE